MAHITCTKHRRRVHIMDDMRLLHRSDGSACPRNGNMVSFDGYDLHTDEVVEVGAALSIGRIKYDAMRDSL